MVAISGPARRTFSLCLLFALFFAGSILSVYGYFYATTFEEAQSSMARLLQSLQYIRNQNLENGTKINTKIEPAVPAVVPTITTTPPCDEMCRMVRGDRRDSLFAYGFWAMAAPPVLECKDRRKIGNDVPGDQEAYSLCFDEPYTFTPGNCLVYSFGIANEWGFDDTMATTYKCEVFSFDPSMSLGEHKRPSGVKFYPIGLSPDDSVYVPNGQEVYRNQNPNNWQMRTIQNISKMLRHEKRMIDVLKIDVEGAEVKSLMQALDSNFLQTRVRALTLEWHLWGALKQQPASLTDALRTYRKLRDSGFDLFYSISRHLDGLFPLESYVNANLRRN